MPLLKRAALYWHTVRHLRASQITGRLWRRAWRPAPDLRPPPALRTPRGAFAEPCARAASLAGATHFDLLGRSHQLPAQGGWDDASLPLLWRYNLHYFDDLNATGCARRAAWHTDLLLRWVRENPPGCGSGWEPFPTSLRMVNWIKWALRGQELPSEVLKSLAVQSRWLMRRMETHLLGNHLLANAKALVFAGSFFSGEEAEHWRAQGWAVLAREVREQILEDGAHFELSPMYHAIVLEDMLDLVNLLAAFGETVPQDWSPRIAAMRRWLDAMTHPDGELSFFNDAAFGIAPTRAALAEYATRLALPATTAADATVALAASGYLCLVNAEAYLLCDCAAVGPDYQPGHAHADTLAFELSLGGRRLLVNSGTSEYGAGPERQRQRGTAAHNTVVLDGENSSQVWGGFRVARRARCQWRMPADTPQSAEASHDGYRRLPGANLHRRRWQLEDSQLRIDDSIEGTFARAEAWFHLHPEVSVTESAGGIELRSASTAARLEFEGAASVSVQDGTWHPRFGEVLPNRRIVVRFAAGKLVTRLSWRAAA